MEYDNIDFTIGLLLFNRPRMRANNNFAMASSNFSVIYLGFLRTSTLEILTSSRFVSYRIWGTTFFESIEYFYLITLFFWSVLKILSPPKSGLYFQKYCKIR